MLTIAVVGAKRSGKTTTIEVLTEGLVKIGYNVAAIKHVHEENFTIDQKKKDTWRYAHAGAQIMISVAPKEVATIRKVDTTNYRLGEIVKECVNEVDVVFLEGFKELIGNNPIVPKIVTVKTIDETSEAPKRYNPIMAFSGPAPAENNTLGIPHIEIRAKPEKLVNLVSERIEPSIDNNAKPKGKIMIQVNDRLLPLNAFVQDILKNTVLAMVSALRDTHIKGDENVSIMIKIVSDE